MLVYQRVNWREMNRTWGKIWHFQSSQGFLFDAVSLRVISHVCWLWPRYEGFQPIQRRVDLQAKSFPSSTKRPSNCRSSFNPIWERKTSEVLSIYSILPERENTSTRANYGTNPCWVHPFHLQKYPWPTWQWTFFPSSSVRSKTPFRPFPSGSSQLAILPESDLEPTNPTGFYFKNHPPTPVRKSHWW